MTPFPRTAHPSSPDLPSCHSGTSKFKRLPLAFPNSIFYSSSTKDYVHVLKHCWRESFRRAMWQYVSKILKMAIWWAYKWFLCLGQVYWPSNTENDSPWQSLVTSVFISFSNLKDHPDWAETMPTGFMPLGWNQHVLFRNPSSRVVLAIFSILLLCWCYC